MIYPQATVILIADYDSDTVYCVNCLQFLKMDDEYVHAIGGGKNEVEHYGECPVGPWAFEAETDQVENPQFDDGSEVTNWADEMGWY